MTSTRSPPRSTRCPTRSADTPVCVIARTRKGKGVAMMEESPQAWHLGLLGPELKEKVVAEISARMA